MVSDYCESIFMYYLKFFFLVYININTHWYKINFSAVKGIEEIIRTVRNVGKSTEKKTFF